jgi:cation:H+ antiporter
MLFLLIAAFVLSLLVAVAASASFTRRLEVISDALHFSPGLLSLLGALGANIPNYVASLVAAASGQVEVGIGIIIGSNIYNIAVILSSAAFASPGHHGLHLSHQEAHDARLVGGFTLAMMCTTALAVGCFSWKSSPHLSQQATLFAGVTLFILNLLTLCLFCLLCAHALQRTPETPLLVEEMAQQADSAKEEAVRDRWQILRVLGEIILVLAIALGGVIVMVQTGEAVASDIHLPSTILSLIVLAIATSLPNTIVAFTLARTKRASASIEELFSSNGVNAALGIALPLLLWSSIQNDRLLVILDGPLMLVLTCVALLCVHKQRVSRVVGALLLLTYVGWIALHLLL